MSPRENRQLYISLCNGVGYFFLYLFSNSIAQSASVVCLPWNLEWHSVWWAGNKYMNFQSIDQAWVLLLSAHRCSLVYSSISMPVIGNQRWLYFLLCLRNSSLIVSLKCTSGRAQVWASGTLCYSPLWRYILVWPPCWRSDNICRHR